MVQRLQSLVSAFTCVCVLSLSQVCKDARLDKPVHRSIHLCITGVIILIAVISKVAYSLDISSYRRLDDTARLTLINRALFCLVYLVSFVPYSISTYFIFFSPTTGAAAGHREVVQGEAKRQMQAWALRLLSFLLGIQLSMHVYEVGASVPAS